MQKVAAGPAEHYSADWQGRLVTADKTSEDEQDLDLLLERTSLFTEAVIRLCLLSLGLSRV